MPCSHRCACLALIVAPRHFPPQDALESIVEMREHDVPYHVRFAIDTDVRCGHWFTCKAKVGGGGGMTRRGLGSTHQGRWRCLVIARLALPHTAAHWMLQ